MALFGLTAIDVTAANSPPAGSSAPAPAAAAPTPPSPDSSSHGAALPTTSTIPDLLAPSTSTYLTEPPASTTQPYVRSTKSLAPISAPPPTPPVPDSTSRRALNALSTSPSGSASRRLPPIGVGSSSGNAAAAPPPAGTSSPERELGPQPLSTPQSHLLTPRDVNTDQRNFDGKDLHEMVRLSVEDYSNVPRVQSMLTLALASTNTEASKMEALVRIREASVQNPQFTLTPFLLDCIRDHLRSRNRLLRPAAAYALAGYAANSRFGRGLMSINSADVLPRLVAMLRCKLDSMDARYAALAILTASLHSEHKELVGRSGAIPLLIALVRQNIGRAAVIPAAGESSLEHVLMLYDSQRVSELTTTDDRPETSDTGLPLPPSTHLHGGAAYSPRGPVSGSGAHPDSEHHRQHHGGAGSAGSSEWPVGMAAGMARMFASEANARGTYVLSVKPAAAHAAAVLVNLAELATNRQRMRDAGIASMLEDVLFSRNESVIKERCRLLVDFLQMDTKRFKEAQASSEVTTVAVVSHAIINFVSRSKEAKVKAAAAAAAAAANAATAEQRTLGGLGALSSAVGRTTLQGTLAWSLAKQLEQGEEEDDRRFSTMKQRHGHSMSRAPSQAFGRAQSHSRRAPGLAAESSSATTTSPVGRRGSGGGAIGAAA